MMDDPTKLDLITDEELVNELMKRYDDMIFAGRKNICKDNIETTRYWNGDEHITRGLCMDLVRKIDEQDEGELDD